RRVYSQNIDGLEYQTNLPPERLVSCHGSLGQIACEACGAGADTAWFLAALRANIKDIYGVDPEAPAQSTPIRCPSCGAAAVKPSTVLYGRQLPAEYFAASQADFPDAVDALVVVGTSLTIKPVNQLPLLTNDRALRVFVNLEP